MTDALDAVVVGGGSAGCVLAARLAEESSDRWPVSSSRGRPRRTVRTRRRRWPEDMLDGRRLALESHDWGFDGRDAARAKILGGCSSHNACFLVRAAPGDHARWVELGNLGWGFDEQSEFLERVETQLPAQVPGFEELTALDVALPGGRRGGRALRPRGPERARLGARSGTDAPEQGRLGALERCVRLPGSPSRDRPNLRIQGETLVDRIEFEGTRATAIIAPHCGR